MVKIQLFFLTAFLVGISQGQDPPRAPDISEQIVVTAQFRPESSKETIIEVKVLDRAQIEARGARTLGELLAGELQIETKQHSVFGTGLTIGGISGENVKILVNGMPVIGRLDGIIDLEQIDLSAFERVEIIEGPASVYYGTDALGGVVNLIPHGPALTGPQVELRSSYRELGDAHQKIRAGFALGNSSLTATLAARNFNGEDRVPESRNKEWADRDQESAALHWTHRFRHMNLAYWGSFNDESLTDLGEYQDGIAWDQEYQTQRMQQQFTLDGQPVDRIHYSLSMGYGDYDRKRVSQQSFVDPTGRQAEMIVDPAFNNAFNLTQVKAMVSMTDLVPSLDGQIGVDWNLEQGSGGRILSGSQELRDRAIFGGLRWKLPGGLVVQPMVRLMDNTSYDAPTTPSLHMMYQRGQLTWRASYSRGFRGPSIKQLYLDFSLAAGHFQFHITGNDALRAERSHHYRSSIEAPVINRNRWSLFFTGHLYFNTVDNLIVLTTLMPNPQVPNLIRRSYTNVNEHRSRGADIGLLGRLGHTQWDFSLARTETYNALSATRPLRRYNGRWDGRLTVNHQIGKHRLSLLAKHVGEQPGFVEVSGGRGRPTVVEEVNTQSYNTIDTFWHYRPKSAGLFFGVGVKNLSDHRNSDVVALGSGAAHQMNQYSWGRTAQLELGWRWQPQED